MNPITSEEVRIVLNYDKESGDFTWKSPASSKVKVGDRAGSLGNHGYWVIKINGKRYQAHRIAWLYVYGEFPVGDTDHINRIKTDNCIANLRDVSRSINKRNCGAYKTNVSGFKGVRWVKENGKWRAIYWNGKTNVHLGYFCTPEEASAAYQAALAPEPIKQTQEALL